MNIKKIEEKVLKCYQDINPSFYGIENDEIFKNLFSQRKTIYQNLQLLPYLYKAKKILEIGGGTGEKALINQIISGADITIVDMNNFALERAKLLFKQYGKKVKCINKSIFQLKKKDFSGYDLVICEGVIHHTADPLSCLNLICDFMDSNSMLLLAMAEKNGWYQRQLQRNFVRSGCENDKEKIFRRAKKFFSLHLKRAVKFGLRSEESVINDTFVNPQIKVTPIEKIISTFKRHNIFYISSFPTLHMFSHEKPINQNINNSYKFSIPKIHLKLLKLLWRTGYSKPINFFDKNKYKKLMLLDRKLKTLEIDIKNDRLLPRHLNLIQVGPLSYGMNYFFVYKDKK